MASTAASSAGDSFTDRGSSPGTQIYVDGVEAAWHRVDAIAATPPLPTPSAPATDGVPRLAATASSPPIARCGGGRGGLPHKKRTKYSGWTVLSHERVLLLLLEAAAAAARAPSGASKWSITGRDEYLSAATHCWKAKLLVVRPDTLDSRSPGLITKSSWTSETNAGKSGERRPLLEVPYQA